MILMIVWIGTAPLAGAVSADSAAQIQHVCNKKHPKDPDAQQKCRGLQTAAATKLLMRIEAESETSLEFAIASSCIERARVKQPAMVDWSKALACFKSRLAGSEQIEGSEDEKSEAGN